MYEAFQAFLAGVDTSQHILFIAYALYSIAFVGVFFRLLFILFDRWLGR